MHFFSGNVLVDLLTKKWYGEEFDEDGNKVCIITDLLVPLYK